MANNSIVTQEKLQEFYDTKIYDYLNGATHTGCVPLGTILPYFGETAPTHFLICDGTAYNKNDYPELAAHLLALTDSSPYVVSGDDTKFKVPDLRGEFLRGSGTNGHTNQGSGANVGVHQNATEMPSIYIDNNQQAICAQNNNTSGYNTVANQDKSIPGTTGTGRYVKFTNEWSGGTSEQRRYTSRPTNTSVTYIIAYRNAYIDLALDSFPIDISNPTDGQLLMYDATAGRWVNGGHKYSTDEHVVGTWIDGRPIYEKVIEFTLHENSSATYTVDTDVSIAHVILFTAMVESTGHQFRTIPYFVTGVSDEYIEIGVRSNSSQTNPNKLVVTNTIWAGGIVFVTIQYTKTTDTV